MLDAALIERILSALASARRLLFITGAGLSAESGLPTYRGIGGLYNRGTEEGVAIEEALSGEMMRARPEISWKYISEIELTCRGAGHNRGHEFIAGLGRAVQHSCVLTQNVDGFHRAAGSENVIAIHGDLHRLRCVGCGDQTEVKDFSGLSGIPPSCTHCGELIRPEVVLFNELLPGLAVRRLREELALGFDLIFSIGTTSMFSYIAQPVVDGRRSGATTIEINPGETAVSSIVDIKIEAPAGQVLGEIWEAWEARGRDRR